MKTIQEWFESFPVPDIRARLLANLEQQPASRNDRVATFQNALMGGFSWYHSIEGHGNPYGGSEFWENIYGTLPENVPATTEEYYARLHGRIIRLHLSISRARRLLRDVSRAVGWLAHLDTAGARFIDEALIRQTIQRVEEFLKPDGTGDPAQTP